MGRKAIDQHCNICSAQVEKHAYVCCLKDASCKYRLCVTCAMAKRRFALGPAQTAFRAPSGVSIAKVAGTGLYLVATTMDGSLLIPENNLKALQGNTDGGDDGVGGVAKMADGDDDIISCIYPIRSTALFTDSLYLSDLVHITYNPYFPDSVCYYCYYYCRGDRRGRR